MKERVVVGAAALQPGWNPPKLEECGLLLEPCGRRCNAGAGLRARKW